MKAGLLMLALIGVSVPGMAETITVRTPNQRFVVIDRIYRTNATVYTVFDTETGEIVYRLLPLPPRRLKIDTRVWDPRTGRFREIIGYDHCSMAVYRDDDHTRVVYWVTENTGVQRQSDELCIEEIYDSQGSRSSTHSAGKK